MAEPIAIRAPRENVNDETVTVSRWLVADGTAVRTGDVVVEVETSKTNVEVEAPSDGYLRHAANEGDDVAVGNVLCWLTDSADTPLPGPEIAAPSKEQQSAAALSQQPAATLQFNGDGDSAAQSTRFSRDALALLEARGLDRNQFAGRGLVRATDIRAAMGEQQGSHQAEATPVQAGATGVDVRREALSRQKRTESRYLSAGHRNALASAVTLACPTRGLRALAQNESAIRGNATALIVHETARLLAKYPNLNAYYEDGAACYYESINIGFAVDGPYGLKVAVVHDADKKDLSAIAAEMEDLIVKYAEDNLDVVDLAGGTFTLTDLSGEDVTTFFPLINQGQSAILGVGAEQYLPGHSAGTFALTLTFDHQLSAGREAAMFLRELRDRLAAYEESFRQKLRQEAGEPVCSVCLQPLSALHARVYLLQRLNADGTTEPICSTCAQGY